MTPPSQQEPSPVNAAEQNEVVGHKTFSDGHGGFRHEPLTRADADKILALCDAQQAERTARYPTAEDAVRGMCDAHHRLREMGWREATYAPPDGKLKRVIEAGSSGIHEGYCEARPDRPGAKWWWLPSEGDLWPSNPILYYPGDDERLFAPPGQDKPSGPPPEPDQQSAVAVALERAAGVCDAEAGDLKDSGDPWDQGFASACECCATAIRSLLPSSLAHKDKQNG